MKRVIGLVFFCKCCKKNILYLGAEQSTSAVWNGMGSACILLREETQGRILPRYHCLNSVDFFLTFCLILSGCLSSLTFFFFFIFIKWVLRIYFFQTLVKHVEQIYNFESEEDPAIKNKKHM